MFPHFVSSIQIGILVLEVVFVWCVRPSISGNLSELGQEPSIVVANKNLTSPEKHPQDTEGKVIGAPLGLHQEPIEIVRRIVIQPKMPGAKIFPDQRLDLEEIESGKKYLVKIQLVNESNEPLVFRRVGANCSCVDLRVSKGEIPAGESLDAEALISVPERQETQVFLVGIDFYSDKDGRDEWPFLRIRVQSAKVRGLICFGAIPSTLQIGHTLKRLSLPLLVTEPVDSKSLVIEKSESLQDAVISVAIYGEREELIIDVSGVLLDEGFRDCWVKVKDANSERSAEARFLLEKSPLVSVSPKVMTFRIDAENSLWKAKAFLVLDVSAMETAEESVPAQDSPVNSEGLPLLAKAEVAGHSIDVQTTRLRRGLYRIELKFPVGQIGELGEGEICWSVEYGSFIDKFNTLWRIPK